MYASAQKATLPPSLTGFSCAVLLCVRHIKPEQLRGSGGGSYGYRVALAPCETKARDPLNECNYQETDIAMCLFKAHLELCSCNTATERFSIKKNGFDDFGILNTDRQHKYKLS